MCKIKYNLNVKTRVSYWPNYEWTLYKNLLSRQDCLDFVNREKVNKSVLNFTIREA